VISLIREQYEQIMRQGAILVDDTDAGDALSAIFLLEHTVQDGRVTSAGKPHVISQRLQFAAIDKAGNTVNAGIAPHLNLRPAKPEEVASVRDLLGELADHRSGKGRDPVRDGRAGAGPCRRGQGAAPARDRKGRAGGSRPAQEGDQLLGLARLRAEGGGARRQEDAGELAERAAPGRRPGGSAKAPHGPA
jgi:hypothetical protein